MYAGHSFTSAQFYKETLLETVQYPFTIAIWLVIAV